MGHSPHGFPYMCICQNCEASLDSWIDPAVVAVLPVLFHILLTRLLGPKLAMHKKRHPPQEFADLRIRLTETNEWAWPRSTLVLRNKKTI